MNSLEASRVNLYREIEQGLPNARTIAAVKDLGERIAAMITDLIGPALCNLPKTLIMGDGLMDEITASNVNTDNARLKLGSRLRVLVNTRIMEYEEKSRALTC